MNRWWTWAAMAIVLWGCGVALVAMRIRPRDTALEVAESLTNTGALVLLAREADGSMRDAQSLLEQVLAYAEPAGDGGEKTQVDETLLQEVLGTAGRQVLYDLSAAVTQADPKRCIELVSRLVVEGRDLCRVSRDLVEHFRNLLVARLTGPNAQAAHLLDLPEQEASELARQVQGLSVDTLLDYFDLMAAGDEEVARSPNPRFALESVLVRLATLSAILPVTEVLQRLERLEEKISRGVVSSRPAPYGQTAAASPVLPLNSPATTTPSAAVDKDEVWQKFLAFVGTEKKFLASHLAGATVLEISPGQLKIGLGERHHLTYLQDADNFTALKSLANQFFEREVALSIATVAAPASTFEAERDAVSAESEQTSEMAKEVLRIFGGSVKAVRKESR